MSLEEELHKFTSSNQKASMAQECLIFHLTSGFFFTLKEINTRLFTLTQPRSDFMIYVVRKFNITFRWIVSVHGKYDTYLESTEISNRIKQKIYALISWVLGKS